MIVFEVILFLASARLLIESCSDYKEYYILSVLEFFVGMLSLWVVYIYVINN